MDFLMNFFEGLFFMGLWLGVLVIIWITALPVVLVLKGASSMLLLWYLLILPFDYAVWQTLF